jgi:hypothetical protein
VHIYIFIIWTTLNFSYSLTSKTYLSIDPLNGVVTVNADFNYERQPQVIVTVKAEDTNIPPHIAYAQITVNVQDINDEKPELSMVTFLSVALTLLLTQTYIGFQVLTAVVMKSPIFWDITPCSPLKVNRRFGEKRRLHLQGRRVSQKINLSEALLATCLTLLYRLTYSSTVKMEAICSSETSVDFQRTTRRYIPEDRTLHVTYSQITVTVNFFFITTLMIALPWSETANCRV